MMIFCFGRKSFVVLLCAFCIEVAFAQFPAMKQQEWYKKNVLNNATTSSTLGEQDAVDAIGDVNEESVLQKIRNAINARQYAEAWALYPQAKSEYRRNPQTYNYARMTLRALVNETKNQEYLDQLELVYNDYYQSGNGGAQSYEYSSEMRTSQWNEGQWMKDWTVGAENVYDYKTRYARLKSYILQQEDKADPVLSMYLLNWLSKEHAGEGAALRTNASLGLKYYESYNELLHIFEKSEAYLKTLGLSEQYDFGEWERLCRVNMWDVIPYEEYERLYAVELRNHQKDIAYLDDFLSDCKRFKGKPLYTQAEAWREKLGIEETFAGFSAMGDRRLNSNKYGEAMDFYKSALALAVNDEERSEVNGKMAAVAFGQKSYAQSYNYLKTAMQYQENVSGPKWAHYSLLINIYIQCGHGRSMNSANETRDRIGYFLAAEQCLAEAQNKCDDVNENQVNVHKKNIRTYLGTIPKATVFMQGVQLNGQTHRISSPVPVTVELRDIYK